MRDVNQETVGAGRCVPVAASDPSSVVAALGGKREMADATFHRMFVRPSLARARRAWLLAALVLLTILGIGLGAKRHYDRRPLARNVVVVLVDTLRADHLSTYGYSRETSPELDRIARARGLVFDNVRSQAPCTFPSVNSLMTSRSPLIFSGRGQGEFSIPVDVPTLASMLGARGFSTAAVSASPIVRATPSKENPSGGFGAGFDRFDESCYWLNAPCVHWGARRALDALAPPFLLYLHYMEPHDPYLLSPDVEPRFTDGAPEGPDRDALLAGDPNPFATRLYESGEHGLNADALRFLVDRYDEDIYFWDRWFGELIAELERRGLAEDTIVAVVSDHGEEFLEHGDLKHCRNLFDTTVKVPMVLMVPGVGPRRLAIPASNLDLVPTLLDLLGVSPGEVALEGQSLRRWTTGWPARPRSTIQRSWWNEDRMVSDGTYKLIVSEDLRSPELFRLDVDPAESANVLGSERAAAGRLRDELRRWMELEPGRRADGDEALESQLKALGYLQ